jgi:hypothetical protein
LVRNGFREGKEIGEGEAQDRRIRIQSWKYRTNLFYAISSVILEMVRLKCGCHLS